MNMQKYRIEAMDCPTEEAMIRGKLEKMEGIDSLDFNLVQRVLTVEHQLEKPGIIQSAIKSLGFEAIDMEEPLKKDEFPGKSPLRKWMPMILAAVAALLSEAAHWFDFYTPWVSAALAVTAVLISGLSTYKKGWISIINGNLNINALMSIAVTGAMIIGIWPEAAMVMVLFALSEKIEALSLDKARNAIEGLLKLSPDSALVQQSDGSWLEMVAADVAVGSLVRVGPGGRISHDGKVQQGFSVIDQSAITGESIPVEKQPGDQVFAGTVNQHGEITVEVEAKADNSTLSRIIHLVEEAQANRSATQRFVDSFAKVYTPVVMGLSILVAVLPPLLLHQSWLDWIYRALVLLIIACPCALVISTPVTIVSALAKASRLGIIIKGGVFMEQASRIQWVAFDKTGTITQGIPRLTDITELVEGPNSRTIARLLASRSDHPVSTAVAAGLEDTSLDGLTLDFFEALPGKGIQGRLEGELYYLGNHRLIEELGLCSKPLEEAMDRLEEQGKTTVILAGEKGPLALFAVADGIKISSRQALKELHQQGIKSLMISGDNLKTVASLSKEVGIDDARGELLPQEKARVIKDLRENGQVVAMAGDGINDAPALAYADIGIAMGGMGSDTAIEAADVVIMDDDIRKIPLLISLSRRTMNVLTQNIIIALAIKAVFFGLTLAGLGTMWMAVFADMGASLIVVFNGMRLLNWKNKGMVSP